MSFLSTLMADIANAKAIKAEAIVSPEQRAEVAQSLGVALYALLNTANEYRITADELEAMTRDPMPPEMVSHATRCLEAVYVRTSKSSLPSTGSATARRPT